MIKFLLICFFMTFNLLNVNAQSLNFITQSDINLVIDGYEINPDLHVENSKKKFDIDTVCIDLFDFNIVRQHILNSELECSKRLLAKDTLCLNNISLIQQENKKLVKKLNDKILNLVEDKKKLSISFNNKEELLNKDINLYKWILGISSISFVSTIIIISVN